MPDLYCVLIASEYISAFGLNTDELEELDGRLITFSKGSIAVIIVLLMIYGK